MSHLPDGIVASQSAKNVSKQPRIFAATAVLASALSPICGFLNEKPPVIIKVHFGVKAGNETF